MNHFAYPQMFWLLLLPFLFRAVLPAVKGLHGDALRVPFIGDLVKIKKLRPRHSDGYGYLQFHAGTRFCASRPAY